VTAVRNNPDGPVWIDLANSPHVLFFSPVIQALSARGIDVLVTARDFAQTVDLCKLYGLDCTVIGTHGGAGIPGKLSNLYRRVRQLSAFVRDVRPSVAVSHNSYTQLVAARSLRIPCMTAMDYEHQPANHLAFRAADVVAVPEALPLRTIRLQGASPRKTWRYAGIKEHISLAGFRPSEGYLRSVGLDPDLVTVVVRTPADMALYHRFENVLFRSILERLRSQDVQAVVLARTPSQADGLERDGFGDLLWRGPALDGRELVAAADLVVSAGGSMNREAAVLGTPAYSVYAGAPAAVDEWLARSGLLTFVRDQQEIASIPFEKRDGIRSQTVGTDVLDSFVRTLLSLRESGARGWRSHP
jgi:uncharacterized protein